MFVVYESLEPFVPSSPVMIQTRRAPLQTWSRGRARGVSARVPATRQGVDRLRQLACFTSEHEEPRAHFMVNALVLMYFSDTVTCL